jgi:hypothetical protein
MRLMPQAIRRVVAAPKKQARERTESTSARRSDWPVAPTCITRPGFSFNQLLIPSIFSS